MTAQLLTDSEEVATAEGDVASLRVTGEFEQMCHADDFVLVEVYRTLYLKPSIVILGDGAIPCGGGAALTYVQTCPLGPFADDTVSIGLCILYEWQKLAGGDKTVVSLHQTLYLRHVIADRIDEVVYIVTFCIKVTFYSGTNSMIAIIIAIVNNHLIALARHLTYLATRQWAYEE